MTKLEVGAYFKMNGEGYEFKGVDNSGHAPKIIGRAQPDMPEGDGSIHKAFTQGELEQSATFVPPFGELLSYADYVKEKQVWQNLFGPEFSVPYPPKALVNTLEKAREEGFGSFVPHYLPALTFLRDGIRFKRKKINYPDDWVQIDFFEPGPLGMVEDINKTDEAWVLVDATQKGKTWDLGYANDPFGDVMKRAKEAIFPPLQVMGWELESRYNISFDNLRSLFNPSLSKKLGLERGNKVRVPRLAELNVLGNLFHPDWGNAETDEWTQDKYFDRSLNTSLNLGCGNSKYGGLSHVERFSSGTSSVLIGFRPMIDFPVQYVGKGGKSL